MARITVEDCLKKIENPFELVLLAAQRARDLMRGMPSQYDLTKEKLTVVALREIADGAVERDSLIEQMPVQASRLEPAGVIEDDKAALESLEDSIMQSLSQGARAHAEELNRQELSEMTGFTDASENELNDPPQSS